MNGGSFGIVTIVSSVLIIGLLAVLVYDLVQTRHAVLRNYPVIGHLRCILEPLGEYLRQYFYAGDREETPFNRATRTAWALCAGADFVNTARGFMLALGCIQAMRCHTNTCPTGITTHNKRLQRGLAVEDKFRRVANYAQAMNKEIDMIAYSCGLHHARELRREHVRIVQTADHSVALNMLYPYPTPGVRPPQKTARGVVAV